MPDLARAEVEQIAALARLHLEPAELDRMQHELGAILAHVEALAAVDTTDVPPLTHPIAIDLRLRADEIAPSLPAEAALAAAPKTDGAYFVVPAILGDR
ncbi:MAG TPA: Asp-tRNA(Asn)/Glu-tRNA(Gln) amidotransferase subunit GatC [Kofleriaceae bacterium]|jgi:aspartyl-tRNA(Asn)/glutamyl-tRNA(Gln) amidotransferase subunit C